MEFCKDCRHYDGKYLFERCNRKTRLLPPDIVDGGQDEVGYRIARFERSSWLPWNCGAKARHFVPIKTTD